MAFFKGETGGFFSNVKQKSQDVRNTQHNEAEESSLGLLFPKCACHVNGRGM